MSNNPKSSQQQEKERGLLLFWSILIGLIIVVVIWIIYRITLINSGVTKQDWHEWIDWILFGFAGAMLYALVSVAHWYQRQAPRFRDFTLWYLSTIIKGPILAFIILLFLTTVNIEVAGINVDFTELSETALLVAAFLLGFYNRVARETLNQITKSLFGKAYGQAEEQFSITPGTAQVVFAKTFSFKLSRATDVTWLASLGKIDDAGLYTAPAQGDFKSGQIEQITAVPKDANIPRAIAVVTLRTFEIKGQKNLKYGNKSTYTVDTGDPVTWSSSIGEITDAGEFTAPSKEDAQNQTSAIITAAKQADAGDLATFTVYLKE